MRNFICIRIILEVNFNNKQCFYQLIKPVNKKNNHKHGKDLNIFSHLSVSDDKNKKKKSKSDGNLGKNKYHEPNPFSDSEDSSDRSSCRESSDA